jgi:hypothetical protein
MSKRTFWLWIAWIILTLLVVIGAIGMAVYASTLPEQGPRTGNPHLRTEPACPGSQAALRIVAREIGDASPIAGAAIRVALKPKEGGSAVTLYEGTTDTQGTTDANFVVREDASPQSILIIETSSDQGTDAVEREITIERDYKVLLSTDKPIYQRGR